MKKIQKIMNIQSSYSKKLQVFLQSVESFLNLSKFYILPSRLSRKLLVKKIIA